MNYWIRNFLFVFFSSWFGLSFSQTVEKTPHPFPLNHTLIKQIKKQGRTLMSDRVGGYILRAEGLASDKKYDKAIDLLEYHYKKGSFTKSEKAQFAMYLGSFYKQDNKHEKSLFYLQKALDLKGMAYPQYLSTLYNLAQIHVEKESYDKALELLKLWFSINEKPFPQSYILLAHCHYAKDQLQLALKYVEKTIALVAKPKESWLSFAVAIYIKQKKYDKAQSHLERLVALYPSRAVHWRQLANIYLILDKIKHAFVTLDIANKMGHLKNKSDYMNLFSFYLEQSMPYQGAELLKQKIKQKLVPKEQKNLERLAEAFWIAREEKSALVYLKEASKTASRPEFFVNYGGRLLEREQWVNAEKIFRRALQTKKIKETLKNIQNYKKELALANRSKNDFSQYILPQSGNFKDGSDQKVNSTASNKKGKIQQTKGAIVGKNDKQNSKDKKLAVLKAPPINGLENIYLGIGIALYHQEKYTEALPYFKKSIEVNDTFISGYQWIDYTETAILEKRQKKEQLG